MRIRIGFFVLVILLCFTFSGAQNNAPNMKKKSYKQDVKKSNMPIGFQKNFKGEYVVYFDREIMDPPEYRELCILLQNAKKTDTILFKINSFGGDAFSTIAIINAIRASEALTIAEIQTAYSAGGILAMACKKKIVLPYATFMVHSLQTGSQGPIGEIKMHIDCWKKLNDDLIRNTFKSFLTENEINEVNKGGVLWMNEQEIKDRLKKTK